MPTMPAKAYPPAMGIIIPGSIIGHWRDGRPIRLQAGGADDGGGGSGSGAAGGTGTGSQGGAGQSGGGDGTGPGAGPDAKPLSEMTDAEQADYWKRQSRKHEDAWKKTNLTAAEIDQMRADQVELAKVRDANKTDLQKAAGRAEDAERQLGAVQPQMLRLQAAITQGLPAELAAKVISAAKRLVGSTQQELEADAKEFFASAPIAAAGGQGAGATLDQGARGRQGSQTPSVASGAELYAQRRGRKTTT